MATSPATSLCSFMRVIVSFADQPLWTEVTATQPCQVTLSPSYYGMIWCAGHKRAQAGRSDIASSWPGGSDLGARLSLGSRKDSYLMGTSLSISSGRALAQRCKGKWPFQARLGRFTFPGGSDIPRQTTPLLYSTPCAHRMDGRIAAPFSLARYHDITRQHLGTWQRRFSSDSRSYLIWYACCLREVLRALVGRNAFVPGPSPAGFEGCRTGAAMVRKWVSVRGACGCGLGCVLQSRRCSNCCRMACICELGITDRS
ncbi:hypothetical protein BV20DRAFT_733984 [Pilatotrama ljubarskyi]|nr:hypothetical protein BV20DRAFT_733984 [Pilatotrama ljubarskyi]